jgi:hypothetical protein
MVEAEGLGSSDFRLVNGCRRSLVCLVAHVASDHCVAAIPVDCVITLRLAMTACRKPQQHTQTKFEQSLGNATESVIACIMLLKCRHKPKQQLKPPPTSYPLMNPCSPPLLHGRTPMPYKNMHFSVP